MMRNAGLVAVMLALGASIADARSVKLDDEGVVAWVPDKWQVEEAGGATVVQAPGGVASALFVSESIRDLDLAYRGLPKVLSAIAPGMQLGSPKRKTVGGMKAIAVEGTVEIEADGGAQRIEAQILVAITPTKRALYVITMVAADKASSYDDVLDKILAGVKGQGGGGDDGSDDEAAPKPAEKSAPKENPCWEMKGHPNGWSRTSWNGVSFLLPPGWSHAESKNPDTDEESLQISNDNDTITVFTHAAGSASAAWQAIAEHLGSYDLGDAVKGSVVGQPALCARGSRSDGVVFHKGGKALIMLGRVDGDPSAMRGILGSMRWGK